MKKFSVAIGLIVLLTMLAACGTPHHEELRVAPGRLVMENMMLPARFKHEDGSTYMAHLDAIVIRLDDNEVHPLAVINHEYYPDVPKSIFADELQEQAMEFARRGWVAVTFSRRGYGQSEGAFVETVKGCNASVVLRAEQVPAEDIREVLRLMVKKPYVDGSRMISVGASAGGYATIALTADPPPGLVAAISFAAGIHTSNPERMSCYTRFLIEAAATFGKSSRVPTLWVYAENDHFVPLTLGRKMYTAFTEAGGNAEFIAAPPFTNDGHILFKYGTSTWISYVDAFLQKQGLKLMDGLISISHVRTETVSEQE